MEGTEKPGLEWALVIKGGAEREVRRLGEGVGYVEGKLWISRACLEGGHDGRGLGELGVRWRTMPRLSPSWGQRKAQRVFTCFLKQEQ